MDVGRDEESRQPAMDNLRPAGTGAANWRKSIARTAGLLARGPEEDDHEELALPDDGTSTIIEGRASLDTRRSGIFTDELVQKLEAQEKEKLLASTSGQALQAVLFCCCAVMGSLVPLATDFSKGYPEYYEKEPLVLESCEGLRNTVKACGRQMVYSPTVQLFIESSVSLGIGFGMSRLIDGKEGVEKCLNKDRLKMVAPIALIYAIGDLAQLVIIGATSAAFFIILAQLKLLGVAILTKFVLGKGQSEVQWLTLVAVTVGCFLYCDLELRHQGKRDNASIEFIGLSLSLLKVFLSAINAVLTERAFKAAPNEAIWINQTQLKLCSVPFSFFFVILKSCILCEGYECIWRSGPFHDMDWKVALLVLTQAVQNFVVGLVYKRVNAVVKYLATAQSLWITYILNIAMVGEELWFDLSMVVILLVVLVIAYSMAKADPKKDAPKPPVVQSVEMTTKS